MKNRVVVVGAGVGGLTAAALLAKDGFDVTVLEAHVYAGGCAGTFFHKGYRFDAGATLAGGFQKHGPHDLVARRLGITWPIHRADPAWVVHLPDRTVRRYSDPEQWNNERDTTLPELRHFWALQEYTADVVWRFAARIPEWPIASHADLLRIASKCRPDMIPVTPLALTSMGRWLDVLRVPKGSARTFIDAQLLISAQTTADHANALYGSVAMDLPRAGAYHVQGGMGGIAQTLVSALKAQGGKIQFRREVTHIEPQSDHTFRLYTNKHEVFEADIVIANVTPWALNTLLGRRSPRALQDDVLNQEDTWGAFTLYLGVPSDIVPTDPDHVQIIHRTDQPLGEGNSIFVSLSDINDLSRAPDGFRTMTISTHTDISAWWWLKQHDPEGYQARVEQYRDKLLDGVETVMPNLRYRASLILAGTPSAFQYFTRRPLGMVGGFPQTNLFHARGPQTGIKNLWLVGDSVFPGQSTAGVTAGALRVAAEVTRTLPQSTCFVPHVHISQRIN
jgi:C-3',4' desaturase CrtD